MKFRRQLRNFGVNLAVTVGVGFLVLMVWQAGFLEGWQEGLSDMMFDQRDLRGEVVIVAIDDKSIKRIGRWPWSREVHGQMVELLDEAGASVIGYDVLFSELSAEGSDQDLVREVRNSGRVVLAAEAGETLIARDGVEAFEVLWPLEVLGGEDAAGIVNVVPGVDGIVRQMPYAVKIDDEWKLPFGARVLEQWYEERGIGGFRETWANVPRENGLIRINYFAPPGSFPRYSFVDVLEGEVVPEVFADKIVLVGSVSPGLHDDHVTPYRSQLMPGVEVHANFVATVLGRDWLVREENQTTAKTIMALAVVAGVVLYFSRLYFSLVVLVVGVVGYLVYALVWFDMGVIRNLIFPPMAVVLVTIESVIQKYLNMRTQRNQVRKAMLRYLSPAVMDEVLSDPSKLALGGQRKEMTVLFSDIQGFTNVTEGVLPSRLVKMLNKYLGEMSQLVFEQEGVIDKFVGDAVMAFWGAPLTQKDHAWRAVKTALKMIKRSDELSGEWEKVMGRKLKIRIGINSGEMVVGNFGSDFRFDYTVIGDNVNQASRLETINNFYDTSLLISQATYREVRKRVVARMVDRVAVKGKRRGVVIYEVVRKGKVNPEEEAYFAKFKKARRLYEIGEFGEAVAEFEKLLKENPGDGVAVELLRRSRLLRKQKPKDWNGVWRMREK